MAQSIDRREFLKLAGLGGVVFASGLAGGMEPANAAESDFYFVQLSDTHWGFNGPAVNPDAGGTLQKAVAAVNGLGFEPDFIVSTGDLTHTDDPEGEKAAPPASSATSSKASGTRTCASCRVSTTPRSTTGRRGKSFRPKLLQLRSQGRALHRDRQRFRPDGAHRRAAARWLKSDLAKQAADARTSYSRTGRSSISTAVGLGDARRAQAIEPSYPTRTSPCSTAIFTRAPPDDRPHRAPLGEVAHLPAARARFSAQARGDQMGSAQPRTAWVSGASTRKCRRPSTRSPSIR